MKQLFSRVVAVTVALVVVASRSGDVAARQTLAAQVIAYVPAPCSPTHRPLGVGLNPFTKRVYAVGGGLVTVIDAATNRVVAFVPVGHGRNFGLGVDLLINRIYVSNEDTDSVFVLDGNTNAVVAEIHAGDELAGIGVNSLTGNAYVPSLFGSYVAVINHVSNSVVKNIAGVGRWPLGVAVDRFRSRVYVTAMVSHNVAVIDTRTDEVVATVPVGGSPFGIAANPVTNEIYVANRLDGTVSVIDGDSNAVVGVLPVVPPSLSVLQGVATNPLTNRVYVTNSATIDPRLYILDGASRSVVQTVSLPVAPDGVAVDPLANRVYVATSCWLAVIADA